MSGFIRCTVPYFASMRFWSSVHGPAALLLVGWSVSGLVPPPRLSLIPWALTCLYCVSVKSALLSCSYIHTSCMSGTSHTPAQSVQHVLNFGPGHISSGTCLLAPVLLGRVGVPLLPLEVCRCLLSDTCTSCALSFPPSLLLPCLCSILVLFPEVVVHVCSYHVAPVAYLLGSTSVSAES